MLQVDSNHKDTKSVRKVLLRGIFWRILIIETILLIGSLIYRAITDPHADFADLFWFALRIILLTVVIILFIVITFRIFLNKKIIFPLEAIVEANRRLRDDDPTASELELPADAPREIKEIVYSRAEMLKKILEVSKERLNLVNFIRETFGRYLSKKVVEEILESPEGQKIGGRRETVTILFSDLRGFTVLSETKDPEEMVQLLNQYLERMSKVILEYDGMIDEFIGDAILTIFGVPDKRDDDPARAVACGLAMQNALLELNTEIEKEGYPLLEMGIGINTGTVIVGNIGSEMRMKYGIVGSSVNTASRIESNTIGGQILIGESTFKLVKDLVTASPPQTAMMKGLKKPLVYYPVTEIGSPYNVEFKAPTDSENNIEIRLPFHCWKVKDKKIETESITGETILLNENFITASVTPPFEPMTDIKLIFDFCLEAHCFEEIYAKVLSVEPCKEKEKGLNHLRITSIAQKDRDLLNKWIQDISS